jgi:TonB family protein
MLIIPERHQGHRRDQGLVDVGLRPLEVGDGTPIAANLFSMNQIGVLRDSDAHIPQQRRVYAVAWVFYALVLVAAVALIKPHPVRMNSTGAMQVGIAAFNPGPVGTAGTSQPKPAPTQPVKKAAPSQVTRATAVSKDQADDSSQGSGAAAGAQGVGSGSGPVNLGTGAGLTLLKKVTPTYPRLMEQARMAGTVTLDAIIHRDGTIGDITLKSATNDSFAQAAVEAIKQWHYSPIPYEGIVTVTVNFNLPH